MILVNIKVDFDHFFGLKKKLLIARKQLIVIWTDVNRVPFQKLVGVNSMKLQTITTDWDKNVCKHILNPRKGSYMSNVVKFLALDALLLGFLCI